jgi:hypothetical protein
MKFTKHLFLALSLLLLCCSQMTLQVNSSVKRINYTGQESGSSFIGYQINFESLSDFRIDKIQLNETKEIKEFSIYSVATRKSMDSSTLLDKGKYILSFKTVDIKLINKLDEVFIYALSDNKVVIVKSKVNKKAPFRAR